MKRYEYKLEGAKDGEFTTLSLRAGYIWVGNDIPSRTFIGTITNKRTMRAIGKRLLELTEVTP